MEDETKREWSIPDKDYRFLLYCIRQIEDTLQNAKSIDFPKEVIPSIKKTLENARLRDPKFKKA